MNNDNNNPQSGAQNLQKLEEDLQNLTKEAASTVQPPVVPPATPQQAQPTVSPPPVVSPVQPTLTPPAPTDIPVDSGKKGVSVMAIAIVLLVVAIVIAVGYMAYTKFMVPSAPSAPVVVPTKLPVEVPVMETLPPASDSALPDVATPSSSPSASASPSASSTPSATVMP